MMTSKVDKAMTCDKCGAEMEYFERGLCYGWRCPKCEWNVVATNQNHMVFDGTTYEIFLASGNEIAVERIRAVSKVANVNYPAAKEIIEASRDAIFSGNASEIVKKKAILDEAGVAYRITPNFPY